ncbi:hypothetical protein [Winogradskyella luteola]|uniref:Long-chain fatty acid transport protein n=1 Tax=Winogradskyella luteola TaxID=2828330 RepID=A0A9X1F5G6_9FLAO|nr:hypothetical protein [Winogradskyella luteola]MBV7267750.1 hypothetical protein [Winogradskyella luteola]
MKNRILFTQFALILSSFSVWSQTNNLTGSPYSLFGIGVESNSNTGRNSGMGRLGLALESDNQINLYNPASFASIEKERFVFDIGMFTEIQSISSGGRNEMRFASNFSNISLGFNGNGKYGVGLSLRPATSVGYALIGIKSNIEGSNEQFTTNIDGSGGLSEVRLDYGRKLSSNLNVGIKFSYFFGSVDETESVIAENSRISNNDISYYNGATMGFGLQYKLKERYNIGLSLDLPTSLGGKQDTNSQKFSFDGITILEESVDKNIDDFKLPLRFGIGFSTTFKNLLLSADYNSSFWSGTNQEDGVGKYVDQSIFAIGAEFMVNPNSLKYWQRINFRAGINYNTGYLEIDNNRVDSYSASFGFGLPIGRNSGSNLNFSYNVGNRGSTNSFLVNENFSTLNLNLTLSNIWFQQRKYN